MQIMLTNEPALVAGAATLLEEALRDNRPALATLYQTGVFYFALAYCGSNFAEIARLFHVSLFKLLSRASIFCLYHY